MCLIDNVLFWKSILKCDSTQSMSLQSWIIENKMEKCSELSFCK